MNGPATHNFAERLRLLKSSECWTVEEMAAKADLPLRTLENYLAWRNTTEPGLEALVKIAVRLDVSLNWLMLGRGPVQLPEIRP